MWYVYIVKCSDATFYTGITKNIKKRVKAHNTGRGAKYTKSRRPVGLVYIACQKNISQAMRREHNIKKMSRKQKIELIFEKERINENRKKRRFQGNYVNHVGITRGIR